jgi:raffinose/stachyose/melibiose transport system permease protein
VSSVQGALAGPNFSSDIFGTPFYRTFFGEGSQLGSTTLGATVATLMFFVILAGVAVYFFLIHRRMTTHEN